MWILPSWISFPGGFDYNSVIRRVVTQMTNSGLRFVDYATGYSSRADVAARRSVMTGLAQITAEVNEKNAEELGTEYFEVDWHPAARPDHQAWQGKVYSKEELHSVCGLGSKTGLSGINCRHVYYPFVPGVSERLYTDEWLEEQNRKEAETKEWHGKKLNTYEQTQQQRKMETAMRAQRERVRGFQEAGVDNDEITIAKCKYQAQLDEYKQFSKKMGLPEQCERIYQDMRGRVAPSKETYRKYAAEAREKYGSSSDLENLTKWGSSKARQRTTEKKNGKKPVEKSRNPDIIKVSKTTITAKPNSITQTENKKGGIDRNYYDADGRQIKQISNNDHGKPKQHPYGKHGEHAHDYQYDKDGKLIGRPVRELTDIEREENEDIL
ncbi:phage minor capsid protein [Lachnospiraceae bacterium 46-15]